MASIGWLSLGAVLLLSQPHPAEAGCPPGSAAGEDVQSLQAVQHAQRDVDAAWEAFHAAAVGGTLASPHVQAQIEQALHEARGLLARAREAAERGQEARVMPLVRRIHALSILAIAASGEPKP